MNQIRTLVCLGVLSLGSAAPALAAPVTLDFGTTELDTLHLISPSLTEDGFVYGIGSGTGWELVDDSVSAPASGVALATFFNDTDADIGDTLTIKKSGGGTFTFSSVLYRTFSDVSFDVVTITGSLASGTVGSVTLSDESASGFSTVLSPFSGSAIDTLSVEIFTDGTSATLLDNFVLDAAAVPLPASLAGLLTACLGFGVVRRRCTG